MDFNLKIYRKMLTSLSEKYSFITFNSFLKDKSNNSKTSVLRHDVDDKKNNSLNFAKIQNAFGIVGTYYFRILPQSYDKKVVEEIARLGHEIGYHYEDVDLVFRENRNEVINNNKVDKEKLIDLSYESFVKNLNFFRENFDIKTICMHGSPRSKFDNKLIWEKYSYKDLGILGEPYFDVDWNDVGYLTDTGRKWNGDKVSIRDRVKSKYNLNFSTTFDIIKSIESLPEKMMFTFHPQRWNDNLIDWTTELVNQNLKNILKRIIVNRKNKNNIA